MTISLRLDGGRTGELELIVYGEIGWETCARSVVEQLSAAKPSMVTVRINSVGGDAFEGVAIYNALRSCGAVVTCVVEGLAASAASIVAMAGRCIMRRGAMMMIHPASACSGGEADDLRKKADVLERLTSGAVDIYCAKCGKPRDQISALVESETWLSADEALALGLADEIDGSVAPMACAGGVRLGSVVFPSASMPTQIRAAVAARGGRIMDEKGFVAALLALLGMDAATPMEELLASMGKLMQGEKPEGPKPEPDAAPPVPPPPAAQAAAPELRAIVAMVAQADGKASMTAAEAIVSLTGRLAKKLLTPGDAISEQRLTPAEARGFVALAKSDPEACSAALSAFAKGRVSSLTAPNQVTTSADDAAVLAPVAKVTELNDNQKAVCKQMSLTEEAYLAILNKGA